MPTSLASMLTSINDGGANTAAEMRAVITALYDWIPPREKYKMGRLPGETAHAADDFFSTLTGYTDADVTGSTAWSATRGGATVVYSGQSANDLSVFVKAVPAAGVPITIETQAEDAVSNTDNPVRGLIFTDGTSAGSNLAGFGNLATAAGGKQAYEFTGTLTSVTATALSGANGQSLRDNGPSFTRLTWISANTFGWSVSPDTENWTDFSRVDFTSTFTPTHMGFLVSTWGGAGINVASFRYLRVYEADLSV